MKKGYIADIEAETINNTDYRRVLYTGQKTQLVVMSIEPGEEIGNEVHDEHDQFIRIESGQAKVILNRTQEHMLETDFCVIIPAGVAHNVVNTGNQTLKLYTLYSPPEHKDGLVQHSKQGDADVHFDGVTTE